MTLPLSAATRSAPPADEPVPVLRERPPEPVLLTLAGGMVGGALLVLGARRRGVLGATLGAAGMGLLAGTFSAPAERLLRQLGSARRTVELRHRFTVTRPAREVFAFFGNFEHLPLILGDMASVRDFQDGRSHWIVRTAAGHVLEWNALVTKYVPGQVIAWESEPRAPVECTGLVRFTPVDTQETHVEVTLTFMPCHTGLDEAVRALLAPSLRRRLTRQLAQAPAVVEHWVDGRLSPSAAD